MNGRSRENAGSTPTSSRVVVNGRFLAQVQTGVQRYALETLLAFDALLDQDARLRAALDVTLAVPAGAAAPPLSAIRSVELAGAGGHLWEQFALRRHARDAFLINFSYSGPLLKRRQLVTIHDATARALPQTFSLRYRLLHNLMVAVLGRSARAVMTVSDFSRGELAQRFGLQRGDIIVGREGGEHATRPADDAAVLKRYGLRAKAYVFGVGSIKPNKNYSLLGRALRLLPDYPWPVAIAGASDVGIFQHADARPDGFRFLGFVADEHLGALYRQAACFVLPSLYEGFGLPAVEAMANDCPVLAARAAALPEVCGDAALYFDPHDPASLAHALLRAAADPALRARLVVAGRARLARYNWPANARILIDRLLPLLAARGAARAPAAALGDRT